MRAYIFIYLLVFTCGFASAQSVVDYNFLRSSNQSLLMSLENDEASNINIFSDYGNIQRSLNIETKTNYLYQSQEYIQELDVYLFPKRVYMPKLMHFAQTDPENQYHSPIVKARSALCE